jgi:hypothetical protein
VSLRIDDPRSNPSIHPSSSRPRERPRVVLDGAREYSLPRSTVAARRLARTIARRASSRAISSASASTARVDESSRARRVASTRVDSSRADERVFFLHRFRASVFARGARARRRARRCRGGAMSRARRNGR